MNVSTHIQRHARSVSACVCVHVLYVITLIHLCSPVSVRCKGKANVAFPLSLV